MEQDIQQTARGFLRIVFIHLALSMATVMALRDAPLQFYRNMLNMPLFQLEVIMGFASFLLPLALLAIWFNRDRMNARYLSAVSQVLLGCLVMAFSFSSFKTTMPLILPYWSDPLFAGIDRALHLGQDPWRLAYALLPSLPHGTVKMIYYDIWFVPAFFFPVFLLIIDRDPGRIARYLALWLAVWILLGNILALAFLSTGPIYYQRLLGADDFAGLEAAMAAAGMSGTLIGGLQDQMWTYLAESKQMQGPGISAFPSVHVALAALIAAYALERSRLAGLVVSAWAAAILFLSVWLGWHYAVDGYFSILFLALLWRLRLRIPGRRAAIAAASTPP